MFVVCIAATSPKCNTYAAASSNIYRAFVCVRQMASVSFAANRRNKMLLPVAFSLMATGIVPDGSVKLHDLVIATPSGFVQAQEAVDGDVAFAAFTRPDANVIVYVKRGLSYQPRAAFGVGSRVTREPC